tara:strand:+ start:1163 stop:1351 length:189 start_codon:yes stop_codon:yes gene_type:complete
MKKIGKNLVNYIKMISGIFLLLIVVIVWCLGLWFKTVIEVVTWIELKLTRLMKKAFGENLEL